MVPSSNAGDRPSCVVLVLYLLQGGKRGFKRGRAERFEVVGISTGGIEIGDGHAESVQHHCGKARFAMLAAEDSKGGSNTLQAEVGNRLRRACPVDIDARSYPETLAHDLALEAGGRRPGRSLIPSVRAMVQTKKCDTPSRPAMWLAFGWVLARSAAATAVRT
jgi:hypothetical protein